MKIENQSEFLNYLDKWGFKTNPFNKTLIGIKELMKNYNSIEKIRNEIDFDIDGIVYKINDFKIQKRLGNVQMHQDGKLTNFQLIKVYRKF